MLFCPMRSKALGSIIKDITLFASFELKPALGNGEALRKLQTTVDELLDHSECEYITTSAFSPCT